MLQNLLTIVGSKSTPTEEIDIVLDSWMFYQFFLVMIKFPSKVGWDFTINGSNGSRISQTGGGATIPEFGPNSYYLAWNGKKLGGGGCRPLESAILWGSDRLSQGLLSAWFFYVHLGKLLQILF